jgi:inosine-uridine nucleoside N-ribohydrolase
MSELMPIVNDTATANICRVLHAAGRDEIPVAVGVSAAIGPAPELRVPDFIHGADGLGNTNRPAAPFGAIVEPAVDLLARLVAERPDELTLVTLVTLGPLSTIATVVEADPDWASWVNRLVVMGGVIASHGNALPMGEANIAHDPRGAAAVVGATWSTPPLLVGLDVTHEATLSDTEWQVLARQATPAARFLAEPLAFYRRLGSSLTPSGESPCHDLLATMAAALPMGSRPGRWLSTSTSTSRGSGPRCGRSSAPESLSGIDPMRRAQDGHP